MSKLTYIRCGDYDIPNLKLSEQPETSIGKYGRMRKSYLKEHRPILYNQLLMSEKLYPHLIEIDRTTQERMDTMLPHMMEAAGVTEELKVPQVDAVLRRGLVRIARGRLHHLDGGLRGHGGIEIHVLLQHIACAVVVADFIVIAGRAQHLNGRALVHTLQNRGGG